MSLFQWTRYLENYKQFIILNFKHNKIILLEFWTICIRIIKKNLKDQLKSVCQCDQWFQFYVNLNLVASVLYTTFRETLARTFYLLAFQFLSSGVLFFTYMVPLVLPGSSPSPLGKEDTHGHYMHTGGVQYHYLPQLFLHFWFSPVLSIHVLQVEL